MGGSRITLDFLHSLDRLNLILKKKVYANYQGDRYSRSYGSGLTFQDYREYVPGDDFRHIDWRVYARTGKLYIRRFEEERNLTVHILIDNSGSMSFGSSLSKFDYAAMVGLGFAYIALRNNEKFNVNTFSTVANPLKVARGTSQIVSLADTLSRTRIFGMTDLVSSLESYRGLVKSKALIVVVSDFLYSLEEVRVVLQRYKRSELFFVQVLDPAERFLVVEGDVLLLDSESRDRLRTYVSQRLKKSYQDALENHIFAIKDLCESFGASFVSVTSDTPIFETFYHILS